MILRPEFWKSAAELRRQPWRLAAVFLLLLLFVTNIYRAATQSVSHDEAVLFEWYLSGSWSQVLNFEHGNHHVLTDLLSKLTITLFGASEIALRIPALLGGLLYFYAVFRISAFLFGDGFLFLLSAALLSLNPFLLDYLSCARGYGPALGLLFYALYQLLQYLAEPPDRNRPSRPDRLLNKAGAALGLSIGCNAIMIFPGAALCASLLAILFGNSLIRMPEPVTVGAFQEKSRNTRRVRRRRTREASAEPRTRSWERALLHFVLLAAAIGGFLSLLPNQLIELEPGYMGPASLFAILESLVRYSFLHSPWGFRGLAAWFPAETGIRIFTRFAVPAGLLVLVVVAARIVFRWVGKHTLDAVPVIERCLLLLGGMLPLGILLIVVSRYLLQQPYPELRTVMYWIPLLELASLSLLGWFGQRSRIERILAGSMAAVLVLCVVQFLTQFNIRYFAEWAYCAAGKDMMQIIRADHARKPGTRVRVGATWQLEPVINFYRVAWGLDWMAPVYRQSPNNAYDYYLLALGDTALVERLHLKTLLNDRLSGTVLAKRADL